MSRTPLPPDVKRAHEVSVSFTTADYGALTAAARAARVAPQTILRRALAIYLAGPATARVRRSVTLTRRVGL